MSLISLAALFVFFSLSFFLFISLFPPYLKIVCNKMFFYKRYGTKQTEQTNNKTLGKCR